MHELKEFYEQDAERFWNPREGLQGRDRTIYPLLDGLSGSVLEYGCGAGSLLLHLAREARFQSLTGVDISERALERIETAARDLGVSAKVSLTAPARDTLPQIPSGSIDVLLSLDTIEHVLDPYVVLDELSRIGSRDSVFVISVPNYGYIKHVVKLAMGRQPITGGGEPVENWRTAGWDGWHLHTFTKQSLRALLLDCGWEPVRWTGYGDKFKLIEPLRTRYPAFWSGALTVVCRKSR